MSSWWFLARAATVYALALPFIGLESLGVQSGRVADWLMDKVLHITKEGLDV